MQTSNPSLAFESILSFLRMSGYTVEDCDDERRFLRVVAKLDNDVMLRRPDGEIERTAVGRVSYFNIQVYQDGRIEIGVTGYHSRATTIDSRLDAELRRLVTNLYRCLPPEALPNIDR